MAIPAGPGTRVVGSYTVTRPLTRVAYRLLRRMGEADRAASLRAGMITTLDRLAEVAAREEQGREEHDATRTGPA